MNIVANMEALARTWHRGQYRKGPGHRPYIIHPEAVVNQLKRWGYSEGHDPIVLAVGWGHDLFEDTSVPVADVLKACGLDAPEVVAGISWLTFTRDNWPEADSKAKAKAMYIEHVARSAPVDILAVKIADRLCNLRDFAKLHGKRSEKVRSYYWEAEPLFNNIQRLPEQIRQVVAQSLMDVEYELVFRNPYEVRDEWTDAFYIAKNPPIAYGYIVEGKFAYDGCDFCMAFPQDEDWTAFQRKIKKVPRFIAVAYGDGDICPEEINWEDDSPVEWPRKERSCSPEKPCFGSSECRNGTKTTYTGRNCSPCAVFVKGEPSMTPASLRKVSIRFFNDREVRAVWDDETAKWWFCVVDVVAALEISMDPGNYWYVFKNRLRKTGDELLTDCKGFKLLALDGKRRVMDCLDSEGIVALAKKLPSPKASGFLDWFLHSDTTIDGQSKKKAYALFESGLLDSVEIGTTKGLQQIHGYLFGGLYDFAGRIRSGNIAKDGFAFAPARFLEATLARVEAMPENDFNAIVTKYVEMNIAHPFREGNGRATRIWLDLMLKRSLAKCIDWSRIDKRAYLDAMRRSVADAEPLTALIASALMDKIHDRETFLKGIDYSYYYEAP